MQERSAGTIPKKPAIPKTTVAIAKMTAVHVLRSKYNLVFISLASSAGIQLA